MDLCLMIEGQEDVSWADWVAVARACEEHRAERLMAKTGGDADAFLHSPPGGWIVGRVEEAAAQLAELRDAGVSRVMCQQLLHDDLDAVALLGGELGPRLAA